VPTGIAGIVSQLTKPLNLVEVLAIFGRQMIFDDFIAGRRM
jgi:hypothetical protein